MPRSNVLNFLSEFNKKNNLLTNIWGASASKAVSEALAFANFEVPKCQDDQITLVAEHFHELNISHSTIVGGLVADLNFQNSSRGENSYTTRLLKVNGVVVENYEGFHITRNNEAIIPPLSSAYASLSLLRKNQSSVVTSEIDVGLLLFHDTDPENYCHFILDVLSRCYISILMTENPVLILPEFRRVKFHEYYFTKLIDLGYKLHFVAEGEAVKTNKLYHLDVTGRPGGHPILNTNLSAINFVGSLISVNPTYNSNGVLWVSRKMRRRVLQEELIVEQLSQRYDLKCVDLDTMDVWEQASLFDAFRIIVGPHGAAFTNIVFQRPKRDRVLMEIFCKGNGTPSFSLLAKAMGVRHYSFVGERVDQAHTNYPDIRVDVSSFLKFFDDAVNTS